MKPDTNWPLWCAPGVNICHLHHHLYHMYILYSDWSEGEEVKLKQEVILYPSGCLVLKGKILNRSD